MTEINEKNQKLLLGAFINKDFVIKFREYCKQNDIKQRAFFKNVVEFWMRCDYVTQEHIYRGRDEQARIEICKQIAEHQVDEIVSGAEADAAKKKQKKGSSRRVKFRR